MEMPIHPSEALKSNWEIELADGWELFSPEKTYETRGSDMHFKRGSFQYKVRFTPSGGFQENLKTGRKRRLRPMMQVATRQRRGCTSDSQWSENVRMVRRELLTTYPQAADKAHPSHAFLARAEKAEAEQKWETAFNELFLAGAALRHVSAEGSITQTIEVSSASSSRPSHIKRTSSMQLSELLQEPRRVVRRLLAEAKGNEGEAVERALMIRDLEQGKNCQVQLNAKAEDCSICLENCGIREAVRLWPCKHGWYCLTCMRRAADAKMDEGIQLGGIGCPECQRGYSEALLKALLTTEQMDRLHRMSVESAVAASSELRPCPTPDCPNRVALESGAVPRLKCQICHKEHCLLCSASPYHHGKTCEEHRAGMRRDGTDESFQKWIKEVGAKSCPTCKAVVTKENLKNQATQRSECHKMICRICRTKFCFKCLSILSGAFTCGCTPDNHGFIDPETGGFVRHLYR